MLNGCCNLHTERQTNCGGSQRRGAGLYIAHVCTITCRCCFCHYCQCRIVNSARYLQHVPVTCTCAHVCACAAVTKVRALPLVLASGVVVAALSRGRSFVVPETPFQKCRNHLQQAFACVFERAGITRCHLGYYQRDKGG